MADEADLRGDVVADLDHHVAADGTDHHAEDGTKEAADITTTTKDTTSAADETKVRKAGKLFLLICDCFNVIVSSIFNIF